MVVRRCAASRACALSSFLSLGVFEGAARRLCETGRCQCAWCDCCVSCGTLTLRPFGFLRCVLVCNAGRDKESGQVNRVFAQASRPPPLTEDEEPLPHRLAVSPLLKIGALRNRRLVGCVWCAVTVCPMRCLLAMKVVWWVVFRCSSMSVWVSRVWRWWPWYLARLCLWLRCRRQLCLVCGDGAASGDDSSPCALLPSLMCYRARLLLVCRHRRRRRRR
jgi:hypothetical protein